MRTESSGFAFLLVFAAGLSGGCATDHDARSRELVAISHDAAPPIGLLSVADDGSYSFTDSERQSFTRGNLTPAEFETLKSHVSNSALEALYAQRESDPERCSSDSAGYFVTTTQGTACFVGAHISAANARASLEFFSQLFIQGAKR
jgi:hypothetical protein